jgi:hypothetical protein
MQPRTSAGNAPTWTWIVRCHASPTTDESKP